MHAPSLAPSIPRVAELEIFEHVTTPTCAVGEDRCIVYANAAFVRAMGRLAQDVSGKSIRAVGAAGVGDRLRSLVDRCFAEQRVIDELGPRGEGFKVFPWTTTAGERLAVLTVDPPRESQRSATELERHNLQLQKYAKGLEVLVEERTNKLRDAIEQTLALLMNVLPKQVAHSLLAGEAPPAERFECVTVIFVDVVDFTRRAAGRDPVELVDFLSALFDAFDTLVERYGVEKIKTIGDCYFAVAGAPKANPQHAQNVCELALAMQEELRHIGERLGITVQARIGISSGPVVAGVIGQRRFAYDVWGDTVNLASRMQTQGEPGRIQLADSTYELVRDRFVCEARGIIEVKGRGDVETYWLVSRR